MTFISCLACGKEVHVRRLMCPHCGYDGPVKEPSRIKLCFAFIYLLFLLIAGSAIVVGFICILYKIFLAYH